MQTTFDDALVRLLAPEEITKAAEFAASQLVMTGVTKTSFAPGDRTQYQMLLTLNGDITLQMENCGMHVVTFSSFAPPTAEELHASGWLSHTAAVIGRFIEKLSENVRKLQ